MLRIANVVAKHKRRRSRFTPRLFVTLAINETIFDPYLDFFPWSINAHICRPVYSVCIYYPLYIMWVIGGFDSDFIKRDLFWKLFFSAVILFASKSSEAVCNFKHIMIKISIIPSTSLAACILCFDTICYRPRNHFFGTDERSKTKKREKTYFQEIDLVCAWEWSKPFIQ